MAPLSNCPCNDRALAVMMEKAVERKNFSWTARCGTGRSGGVTGLGSPRGWVRHRSGVSSRSVKAVILYRHSLNQKSSFRSSMTTHQYSKSNIPPHFGEVVFGLLKSSGCTVVFEINYNSAPLRFHCWKISPKDASPFLLTSF